MQSSTWNDSGLTATGTLYCDYPIIEKPYLFTPKSSPTSSGGLSDSETGNISRQHLRDSYAVSEQESLHRLASLLHRNTRSTYAAMDSNGQYDIPVVNNSPSTQVWTDQLYYRPLGGAEHHSTYGSSSSLSRDTNWTRFHSSRNQYSYATSYPVHHQPLQLMDNLGSSRLTVASDNTDVHMISLSPKSDADVRFYGNSDNNSQLSQRCYKLPNTIEAASPAIVLTPCDGSRTNRCDVLSTNNRDYATYDIPESPQHLDNSRYMHSTETAPTSNWSLVFDTPPNHAHANAAWPLQPSPAGHVRYPANSSGSLDAVTTSSLSVTSSGSHLEDGASSSCQPSSGKECNQQASPWQQQWTVDRDAVADHSMVPVKVTPSTSIGKTRTRDKYRSVYTEPQRIDLENEFQRATYISAQRKADIASTVGLSERQVKIWFQNRRAKDRRENRKRRGGNVNNTTNTSANEKCSSTEKETESLSIPSSSTSPSSTSSSALKSLGSAQSKRCFNYFQTDSPGGDTLVNTLRPVSDDDRLSYYIV